MKQTFEAAVAAFAPGDRYGKYLSVVRLGLNEGRDPEAVADYIMSCAPGGKRPNRGDVRRAIQYALTHDRGRSSRHVGKVEVLSPEEREERRRLLLPLKLREFVPVTLREYGRSAFTGTTTARAFAEALRLSDADLELDEVKYRRQAACQLRALYPSGGTIWAGTILKPEFALPRRLRCKRSFDGGSGIVDALDLADRIERGDLPTLPTHISLNPQTGKQGKTAVGSPSFDCAETIAAHRFALVEFDELKNPDGTPSPEQVDIVAGLADYSFEHDDAFNVAAVVYSGGKSVHVALRLPDGDLAEYKRMCAHLRDLFHSADDPRFRADPAGLGEQPTTHLRLAGAVRPETGRRQRLCYCVP